MAGMETKCKTKLERCQACAFSSVKKIKAPFHLLAA
jgi:hypothetical protein